MKVVTISRESAAAAVDVLRESFHDYPVMRHVLGPAGDYESRLEKLVAFFVAARALRDEPVLGIEDPPGRLVAAAVVTLPGERPSPPELLAQREALWTDLGADARRRYESYGAIAAPFRPAGPHHHLNMIGVRRSHHGRGFARLLVEAVHELARADPVSTGVSLTTETEANVALYRHLGYDLVGHAVIEEGLETWAFFRPVDRAVSAGRSG